MHCRLTCSCTRFRAWQGRLENKCVLPAIGCQEMKHLPAEERCVARYRPMKFSVGLGVFCCVQLYGKALGSLMGASGSHVVGGVVRARVCV